MKVRKILLFISLIISVVLANDVLGQDLSKLSEKERNKKLIEIARNVYKAPYIKNFYREYGTPTIMEMKTQILTPEKRKKMAEDEIWYGSRNDQKYYVVYFAYDSNKERFEADYAAKVYIWEDTGKAFAIGLGNMFMYPVRNGKIPNHDTPAPKVEYYTISYSKDVPNVGSLPKKAKEGDIITLELATTTVEASDGWTTERGYSFDPDNENDLTGGWVLSDNTNKTYIGSSTTEKRIIKIFVTGEMKVNVHRYVEEYEDAY